MLARNATRPRRVDEAVVRSQLERVRTTAGEGVLAGEGCATVWIGRTPEAIDAVLIQRVPGRVGPRGPATRLRSARPSRPGRDERDGQRGERDPDGVRPVMRSRRTSAARIVVVTG